MDDHEGNQHQECASDDCASGKRNRYYQGKRMRPVAFEVEQTYLVERRRLLNRAIHGWGVVYGFGLRYAPAPGADAQLHNAGEGQSPRHATLTIGEGLALDKAGRELVQVGKRTVSARDLVISDEDRKWLSAMAQAPQQDNGENTRAREACWLLSVHYAERLDGPVRVKDDCSCERAEWDYLCESVRYSVTRVDPGRCRAVHPCELGCRCTGDEPCAPHADPLGRSSQQCMSRHLSRLDPNPKIAMTEHQQQLRFDLANGIALASVGLRWHCGAPEFTAVIDDWGPRRLVKRNDLLFDLIRGCDLTRISDISWQPWHRNADADAVKWEDFAAYFKTGTDKEFTITFSGPVQRDTVKVDCFAMSVVTADNSGWGEVRRVPIADVLLSDRGEHDPDGSTRSVTLVFDPEWLAGELEKDNVHSLFSIGPSRVEIEVRTSFIVDMSGQSVDGSPIGAQAAPTGNGSPGGCYLSTFCVKSRPRPNGDN